MIEIPDPYMSMLVSAVRDAVVYNQGLLRSETLDDRSAYEEHLVHLSTFFEFVKEEYQRQAGPDNLPLSEILGK
jgi:hypothetical protein